MSTNLAQTAIDKLEIQELITRYAFTYDSGDMSGWAALFTDDLVWELFIPIREEPVISLSGKSAFVDYMTEARKEIEELYKDVVNVAGSFHLMAGTVFDELTESTARTRTMCAPLLQSFNDDGAELDLKNWHTTLEAQILFGGIYHDWFRKVDGRWMIAKKVFYASAGNLKG